MLLTVSYYGCFILHQGRFATVISQTTFKFIHPFWGICQLEPAGLPDHREQLLSTAGTGIHLFLSREGMKTRQPGTSTITPNNKLVALYKHPAIQRLLDTLATETMSAFFGGLTRLGNTYKGLKKLDLSQGVAVMSCEDYANMRRDGYQVHPQGHAALTQQALPISIKALLKHLFSFRAFGKALIPGLTLLYLRLVKVITRTYSSPGQTVQ